MSTITLPNIRVGSDLQVRVRLKDGGVAIDWSTLQNIKACIYSDVQMALAGRCSISIDAEDPTLLVCSYAANKPQYLGANRIVISVKYMGETKTYDKPAFTFVRWTDDLAGEPVTIDDPDVDVEIEVEDISSSILQEAVDAAFTAADRANDAAEAAEHMVDIHTGPKGDKGDKGDTGEKGDTGDAAGFGTVSAALQEDGGDPSVVVAASGPDTAKQFDFTFKNLKGDKGDKGDQGNSGYQGAAGELEVVNNLTDGGSTAALSAEMGKTLEGEVSQLEAEVDDLENIVDTIIVETPVEMQLVTGAYMKYSDLTTLDSSVAEYWQGMLPAGTYRISGFSVNSTYPCLAKKVGNSYSRVIYPGDAQIVTDYEITFDSDTEVIINGRQDIAPISATKTKLVTLSDIYNDVEDLKDDVAEIQGIIGNVETEKSLPLQLVMGAYMMYSDLSTLENSSAEYWQGTLPAGTYKISGFSVNSSYPCLAKKVNGSYTRAIYPGDAQVVSDYEITFDSDTDVIINGRQDVGLIVVKTNLPVTFQDIFDKVSSLSDIVEDTTPMRIKTRKYTDAQGRECLIYDIFKRFNNSYDVRYSFGNKYNTPNANFDFYGIALYNRADQLGDGTLVSEHFAAQTDSILPIIVAATNNADGDFPTSTDLYTGGYHGYNNASTSTTKPTSRTISQKVYADGFEVVDGTDRFCQKVEMVVVTNVQGCNTEKADGSGREIVEQTISIKIDSIHNVVNVQWRALEDVIVYSLHGFAISAPSCNGRFVGSKNDRGLYPIGTVKRTTSIPDAIRAILSSGNYLEICLNRSLDLGRYDFNDDPDSYKATITTANKIYTLILSEQMSMSQNDMVEYEADYQFV